MHFRYARHTTNIDKIKVFYTQILQLDKLGEFKNHDGYNGLFLGLKDKDWHLEFTENGEIPKCTTDEDDLLVFYPTNLEHYKSIIQNIKTYRIRQLEPKNPYWKKNGIMINDPDGYGIIISNLKIKEAT